MWPDPAWTSFLALIFWVSPSEGEIRCYCNDASCISTGYMCKSMAGRCFSQFTYQVGDNARSAHGCVESLPLADRTVCEGEAEVIKARSDPQRWPILMCCKDDMCNYLNNPSEISVYINTKSNTSNGGSKTTLRPRGPFPDPDYRYFPPDNYQQRDLWFKAAVIAVPISGGFILVLLVLLAVRMLRHDSRRHRQLMAMRRHRSLTKAQLYVADHFYDKPERHAHFNSIDCKPNNIYKDVNIRVDCDGHGYEKMSESCQHGGSCNSIIVWGKAGLPTDHSPSVV